MSSQRVKFAWILSGAIVGFSGLALAESSATARRVTAGGKTSRPVLAPELEADATAEATPRLASGMLADPPSNDTCAGAIPLTLNRTFVGTTVDANDDYQTPATEACYPGFYNQETPARGRDVVFSFTAPADGRYTFDEVNFDPSDPIAGTGGNSVLYLTDCANAGTVNCQIAANWAQPSRGSANGSSSGFTRYHNEAIECVQMTAGQTVYIVADDRAPGKCNPLDTGGRGSNCYVDADCGTPGAVCDPVLPAGSRIMVEVKSCDYEVEPNDTPATANPIACGILGDTPIAPGYHCKLGTRDGQVCVRSGFMPQDHPDSRMVCSVSGARCGVDVALGTSNCPIPGEFCQGTVDPDCDPRCDVGPNAGKSCATQAFCNPGSDQGATCAGTCQADSTCVDNVTGVNTGVACTPVCVGSAIPAVNGRYCSALSGCPGGGTCTVTPNPPTPGATCLAGQTCTRNYNEGDQDYFSLGVVPAGYTIFAAINGQMVNDEDYRMRITTDTQTIQFDDDDGLTRMGQSSPVIGGAVATGQPTYIQVGKTLFRAGKGYMLTSSVRPPLAQAQLEDESAATGNDHYYSWPGDLPSINPINNGADNGYVRGTFAYDQDTDCFKFLVNEGDLMDWFTAANPQRTAGPLTLVDIPEPLIYDAIPAGISNVAWGAQARKNNPGAPTNGLRQTTPAVTSSHLQWRAQYTGMLEVCTFSSSQFVSQGVPAYPNDWSASLTVNCGPVQAAGPGTTTADISVVQTGPVGPVDSGDIVEYTIKVENHGTEIAQEVSVDEVLDANLIFLQMTIDDGFSGNNTACFSVPTAGTNDAPLNCINASMTPGQITTYVLTAQVNNCIGAGIQIDNLVTVTSVSTDPDPSNDFSLASFTTSAPPNDGCQDLACFGGFCVLDLCTDGDTCVAGACVPGGPTNCDDNNLCTDDFCDSEIGCFSDSSQNGDLCDDFILCTINSCNPSTGCEFLPEPTSTSCDDGDTCTNPDHCDGAGACTGDSLCADGNPCTDDVAEPGTCACSNPPGPGGTACSDNDACTGTIPAPDACDGAGTCVGGLPVSCEDGDACNGSEVCDPVLGCGAGAPLICDDGSVCTTDTCDSPTGCVYTPINCDDNDACTDSACDPSSGCFYTPIGCDDSDVCTLDTCDAGTGCVHTGIDCNDNDACTTDACDPSGGCFGTPITCDDGNICTTDTCDPTLGCVFTAVVCDDSNVCNGAETCDQATGCVAGTPPVCDDANACNGVESCNPATGCVGGTPLVCDDANACNGTETCSPATGCAAGTPPVCNDGNACNGVESCAPATGCVGGTALICDDANACNGVETCAPATGCVAGTPLVCVDANLCNGVETCNPASGCVAGTAVVCSALDDCHVVGTCNTGTGVCSNPLKPTGSVCSDGDACTTSDTCNNAGTCVGGPAPTCPSDGAACTADVCDSATGCEHSDINLDTTTFSGTRIDGLDLAVLAAAWNLCSGNAGYNANANLDRITLPEACIDATDFHLFMNAFGRSCQ